MAIQQEVQLATVNGRSWALGQTPPENADVQTKTVTVPSGGVVISASCTFSYGQDVSYEYLTSVERTATDEFTFTFKRRPNDLYYVNCRVLYDDDGATTSDL